MSMKKDIKSDLENRSGKFQTFVYFQRFDEFLFFPRFQLQIGNQKLVYFRRFDEFSHFISILSP